MPAEYLTDKINDDEIDFHRYFSLIFHWAWLIILIAFITGFTAFLLSRKSTPYYESSTTILVDAAQASQTTDYSSVLMSEQLTNTYSEMMKKDSVLNEVIKQLNLDLTPKEMRKKILKVEAVETTQLIQITVETTDPNLSADIANSIAAVSSNQIKEIQSQRFLQSKNTLEAQISDLENQIAIYEKLADNASTEDHKNRLDSKANQYRDLYANLLLSYENIRLSEAQSISSLVQVDPAVPNPIPVKPRILLITALAVLIGGAAATVLIILLDSVDDTIKTPEDVSKEFKLPILGVINHRNAKENKPITLSEPRSPTAEAYRTIRTNVSFASVDKPIHTIMITSTEPGEGKSTISCNLGVVFAQNGMNVIITDCDLRHPRIHTYFGLPNHKGLSNLFSNAGDIITSSFQPTQMEKLSVVTTGSLPPNPSELLGSKKMQSILIEMKKFADIVILDTPPVLAVTDAAVLAPSVDGVLLVVRPGKTRLSALRLVVEQINQVGGNILGVILNDVELQGKPYAYQYKYYRNYSAYQGYYGLKGKRKKTNP
jgi:succinoglycan biosynthesis transport protein ExoP